MTDELSFGPLGTGAEGDADLAAQARHDAQAFNEPLDSCVAFLEAVRDDVRVVRSGGRVVGGLARYPMGIFLGGRSVPNAGIAGVAVDPTARGRGVARTLMASAMSELHDAGVAVSTLYPTTFTLYRGAGYAPAGHRFRHELPLHRLGRVTAEGSLRELDRKADRDALNRLYASQARHRNGWLDRNRTIWARVFRPESGEDVHAYVVPATNGNNGEGNGDLLGSVVYTQGPPNRYPYELTVLDLQAATAGAARRLLALFSDCRTLARSATWHGALDDHVLQHVPEVGVRTSVAETWMLRIVHLPAALEARGYPPGLDERLLLDVTDDVVAGNRGRWMFTASDGRGDVRPARADDRGPALRLDVRALASLYTGHLGAARLVALDRAEGSAEAVEAADRLFSGPPPSMPDYF